jgi:superfamily I DNA/RNA helicase
VWDDEEARLLLALTFLAEWRDGTSISRTAQSFLQRVIGVESSAAHAVEAECLRTGAHPGDAVDHAGWRELTAWMEASRHTPPEIARHTASALAIELDEGSSLLGLAGRARTFADFLRAAQAGPPAASDRSRSGVLVTTFHGAKGLEFDSVIIAGCEEGAVPDFRAKGGDAEQEERRALYVAVTRAGVEVLVTWAQRGLNGHAERPSPFLPAEGSSLWGGEFR